MAIDPSIALAVRSPQIAPLEIQTPLEKFQKVLTLQSLMRQGQMGQMQLENEQLQLNQARQVAQERAGLAKYLTDLNAPQAPQADGTPAAPRQLDYGYVMRNFSNVGPAFLEAQHKAKTA